MPGSTPSVGTTVAPLGIRAEGWGWQHADRKHPALQGLELCIEPGERVLLLGPSGAGKSTFLHAAAGLLGDELDAEEFGSLRLDGVVPAQQRGRVGLMQQDPDAQVILSRIGDDVAFGAENLAIPREQIWPRVRAALDAVGLDLPLEHATGKLSGGQKQRLGLAGLLAMEPGLLLLDEPTANLDPSGVLEVRDAVLRSVQRSGATLVVVEHRVAVWLEVVDRIVVLGGAGQGVLFDGAPEQILDDRFRARAALRAAGVWLPGEVPATRARPVAALPPSSEALMTATDLAVSRQAGTGSRRRRVRRKGVAPMVPAAAQIGLTVHAGRALTITGPNGSGKSTLALTLGGLLAPAGGELSAGDGLAAGAGPEPVRWSGAELIERIGTVFQEPEHQFVTGSVAEELAFGPRLLGTGEGRVDELLDRLRLGGLRDANPYTLSGGEKRRLSVATVLAASPQLLILDEPTFGQDANTWAELADLLIELLDAGTAVVSVTHDADFSAAIGGASLRLGVAG